MNKAYITDYSKYCVLCGSPLQIDTHHLIKGNKRRTADEDGIYISLCRNCHEELHSCGTAEKLSKILGQVIWEQNHISSKEEIKRAREEFRKRYGLSYL